MFPKFSRDEWSQWVNSPVTKAVMARMTEERNELLTKMLNLDVATLSLEQYGLEAMALRYAADGISRFDFNSLEYFLVEEDANNGQRN